MESELADNQVWEAILIAMPGQSVMPRIGGMQIPTESVRIAHRLQTF